MVSKDALFYDNDCNVIFIGVVSHIVRPYDMYICLDQVGVLHDPQ